jgi:hypothetical protein
LDNHADVSNVDSWILSMFGKYTTFHSLELLVLLRYILMLVCRADSWTVEIGLTIGDKCEVSTDAGNENGEWIIYPIDTTYIKIVQPHLKNSPEV